MFSTGQDFRVFLCSDIFHLDFFLFSPGFFMSCSWKSIISATPCLYRHTLPGPLLGKYRFHYRSCQAGTLFPEGCPNSRTFLMCVTNSSLCAHFLKFFADTFTLKSYHVHAFQKRESGLIDFVMHISGLSSLFVFKVEFQKTVICK